ATTMRLIIRRSARPLWADIRSEKAILQRASSITRRFRTSVLVVACWSSLWALAQTQKSSDFALPGQIAEVQCASDATQSYAVYLPSSYTAAKRWPIIYFFDPAGRGRHPLELYKEIGETYGFVLAGSNNSRNFSSDQSKAVSSIWADTHMRLALDERRSY